MESSAGKLWSAAQQLLRTRLNAEIYHLWFAPIRAISVDTEILTLEAPNDFSEVWLKDNYIDLIQDAVGQCTGEQLRVNFVISKGGESKPPSTEPQQAAPRKETEHGEPGPGIRDFPFNPKNTFET